MSISEPGWAGGFRASLGIAPWVSTLSLALLALAGTEALASDNPAPFPATVGKKGLQVQMVDDALALNVQHAALNVDLTRLIEPVPQPDSLKWTHAGREFTFNARTVESHDRRIQALSEREVVVYLILLVYPSRDAARDALMLPPGYQSPGRGVGQIAMYNTATPDGQAWLEAALDFIARRYSGRDTAHGRVWGYIVGNEVNSHWFWMNMGQASLTEVADAYERAVRMVHAAVRRVADHARVYVSLDHCWGQRYAGGNERQCVAGRDLLTAFAQLARDRGDFDWHVAYHPYPEPLTDCRFWLDHQHAPHRDDAPVITFRNLDVLSKYLAQPPLLWRGAPRRIILSEQGFHCRANAEGERDQAAAYALAYVEISRMAAVDAFILHRHVDHAEEGGLRLGLWTIEPGSVSKPARKRMLYDVFRAAGTPEQDRAFEFALAVLGVKDWDAALKMLMTD